MKQIEVNRADAGQRLDKYLKRVFPEMGSSFLYKMLRKKNITLNTKKASGSESVKEGDLIQCFFSDETFLKFSGQVQTEDGIQNALVPLNSSNTEYENAYRKLKGITVVYEDEHILLLNKPAGILSQKAKKDDLSLNEWMLGYLLTGDKITLADLTHFKPSVCNRLDRNTSGLVICGKTLLATRMISRMLKDRSLHKYYRTYVHGRMEGNETLTAWHKKDSLNNQAEIIFQITPKDKDAYDEIITTYHALESKTQYSYLEIELVTGKTHQIRAHLSAYGHPIVGDKKYLQLYRKNTGKMIYPVTGQDYPNFQLLHAYRLEFPVMTGEWEYLSGKEFICKEPKEFQVFRTKFFK